MPSTRQAIACVAEIYAAPLSVSRRCTVTPCRGRHGSAQKRDRGGGFLVGENLGVDQPGRVVDRDVHAFPARRSATNPSPVFEPGGVMTATGDAMPGAALDPPELLDIDMDQLAWSRALIPLRRLQTKPSQLAQPDPLQDPRDRGDRDVEQISELWGGEPHPPQRRQQLHHWLIGAVVQPAGGA